MGLTSNYGGGKSIYVAPVQDFFNKKKLARDAKSAAIKKAKKRHHSKGVEVPRYKEGMASNFYKTREWQEARWSCLRASDMHCVACGRGREHGVILHVDHKLARSKFPKLELCVSNLQVLCEDCNMGKGNESWSSKP